MSAVPGRLPRCAEHDLAFVDAHDLMHSGADPLIGTTVAARFTVLSRLGTGSMGSVYRARQEAVGRDVALKIVRRDRTYDPEAKPRFEREARATSALVSPYTVTVFDFGEAEHGTWFLAMELLEGETLGERLKRCGHVDWRQAARLAREALESLGEAHAKGIIHRDLKPDNLFIVTMPTESGNRGREVAKILDFGIAKLVRGDAKVDQLETQAGTVFGTPRYMSPEQAQGAPLDARSDLYSLGVILYQALIGRAPFVDDDAVVVMARHIQDRPPRFFEIEPEIDVPLAMERVVRKALAKAPGKRPQSAEEFTMLIDRACREADTSASGVRKATWSRRLARLQGVARLTWPAAALGLGGLAFVLGVWLASRERPAPAAEPLPNAQAVAALAAPQPPAAIPTTFTSSAAAAGEVDAAASAPSAAPTPRRRPIRASGSPPRKLAPAPAEAPAPTATGSKRGERYGRFE